MVGAITIYSVTFQVDGENDFIVKQTIFIVVGIVVYMGSSFIPVKSIKMLTPYIFGFMVLMLALTLFTGTEINGAKRWIFIFGQSLQFSEFIKPFFLLVLALVLSAPRLNTLSSGIVILSIIVLIFTLLFLQPDLDTGLSFVLSGFLVFSIIKKRYKLLLFSIAGLIILSPLSYFFLLSDFQKIRVDTFLSGILEGEYQTNVALSIDAISSGGLFGKGLGFTQESILRFLPSRQTDFIFAVMVENFGLFGVFFLFYLYWLLIISLASFYKKSKSSFASSYALGAIIIFTMQIVQNIGSNIGLLPASGVILPFMSYGGSGMITNFLILGILNAVMDDTIYTTQSESINIDISPKKMLA